MTVEAVHDRRFLEVLGQVEEDLGTLIEQLDHDGPVYARRYLEHLHSTRGGSPRPPSTMHPLIAKAIREVVLENVDHIPPRLAGGR